MKIYSINTGTFKLDGGAMFGVVPKVIWDKFYPADENNRCTWALRCMLVVFNDRKILIDCGIGEKQDDKFRKMYEVSDRGLLNKSLANIGFSADDITDVLLTHLHFDHCGGAVQLNSETSKPEPTFKNAVYWCGKQQWDLAVNPNKRERASYMHDNFIPLQEAGQIRFIESNIMLYPNFSVQLFSGHTAGQVIPFINHCGKTVVYMADFIPTSSHIPLPYVISYDTQPLVSLKEKEDFFIDAVQKEYLLFFEHDFYHECCTLRQTEKGVRPDKYITLNDFFN